MKVLITGGTGYLGQFLCSALHQQHQVVATCHTSTSPALPVPSVQCDLADEASVWKCFVEHAPFDVVINSAAISQPGACQENPSLARAVNVPTALVKALRKQQSDMGVEAFLIQLSTDQVYDGSRSNWLEGDEVRPCNVYGATKKDAEDLLKAEWPRHVSLRSSIIFGPRPALPLPRQLPLQWLESVLREGKPTNVFNDQYRNSVFVHDVVDVIRHLVLHPAAVEGHSVLNLGGPERLSRMDMAHAVAEHLHCSTACLASVSVSTVPLAVPSPVDISMDSTKLFSLVPVKPTRLRDALAQVFPLEQAS